MFVGFVIPFGGIVAPLILWLAKKEEMPFVDEQGREVLNFTISFLLWVIVLMVAGVAAAIGVGAVWPEGAIVVVIALVLVVLGLSVAWLVFTILGAMKSQAGKHFRYPLTLRLIPARVAAG